MSVIVKGGGGKPEEEKTVTAGTSVIEVNPSSGKVMKKVTVNPTPTESKEVTAGTSDTTVSPTEGKHLSGVTVHPTPSQEKTVIPTADGFKVSPETGKLLSAVFVDGDSDLVAGNIKQGVNIFGVDGSFDNSHGAYVWKKLTAEGGDFVDFAVDNSSTAYPDGGEQGGYWYEKVVEGTPGIDFGEVTLASEAESITVKHSLGVVPTKIYLIPTPPRLPSYAKTVMVIDDKVLFGQRYDTWSWNSYGQTKNTDSVTFNCYQSSSHNNEAFEALTYKWFVIA